MTIAIKISQSPILLCRSCKSPFAQRVEVSLTDSVGQFICAHCQAPWDAVRLWTDESGDMLFELISDVRGETKTGDK